MKTIAIVSSFSESCGNAAFTKVLVDSIHKYSQVQVTVFQLDLKVLHSPIPRIGELGDASIKQICDKLKNFDMVNIQLEPGLYGVTPSDIVRRCRWLMSANPNTSVTFHSVRLFGDRNFFRLLIVKILSLKIKDFFKLIKRSLIEGFHKRLVQSAVNSKCRLIVHTLRSRRSISLMFNYNNIDVHPLQMIPEDSCMHDALKMHIFKPEVKGDFIYIGLFGYISKYKGHEDAIEAMCYLPKQYKLLIFGRQHPQSIYHNTSDSYLMGLLRMIEARKLQDRVLFMGELSDSDFINAARSVDVAWLPYYENGQDGSGVASVCLEASPRVLCSNSFAFDELFKLIPYSNVFRFDIGNYLEIASKTQIAMESSKDSLKVQQSAYSIKTQALLYIKELLKD